jgi:hypothetical protein
LSQSWVKLLSSAAAKAAREEQLHGPQLREIDALQAVVDEANAAATIARTDLATVVEMDQAAFDRLMVPIEKKTAAPWLLKQGDRVVVVEPGATTYQDATPDQLRDGRYYADMQEYKAPDEFDLRPADRQPHGLAGGDLGGCPFPVALFTTWRIQ